MSVTMSFSNSAKVNSESYLTGDVVITGVAAQLLSKTVAAATTDYLDMADIAGTSVSGVFAKVDYALNVTWSGNSGANGQVNTNLGAGEVFSWNCKTPGTSPFASIGSLTGIRLVNASATQAAVFDARVM